MKKPIKWIPKEVQLTKIKPTPKNYKIKTDLGKERLQQSLKLFGLAGTVIVNTDFTLIDGNSRVEEAKERGEKKIWVSMPNRKLTPAEFEEMSAMYDFAKAGEVDTEGIVKRYGSKEDFFKRWGMTKEMAAVVGKMGKLAEQDLEYPEEGEGKGKKMPEVSDIKMVQLFFSDKQEKEFRAIEEKLKKRFKVDSTTDVVFKAFKYLEKK